MYIYIYGTSLYISIYTCFVNLHRPFSSSSNLFWSTMPLSKQRGIPVCVLGMFAHCFCFFSCNCNRTCKQVMKQRPFCGTWTTSQSFSFKGRGMDMHRSFTWTDAKKHNSAVTVQGKWKPEPQSSWGFCSLWTFNRGSCNAFAKGWLTGHPCQDNLNTNASIYMYIYVNTALL